MSAGFGFSVGDIVAGLKLVKQSIEALQDTKGSSGDYQALTREIDSLKDGLEAIEDLKLDQRFGPKSKQGLAVQEAISRCWQCIDSFLSITAKYQPWLQSDAPPGFRWKANLKKIQWALCKQDDVSRFRAQLERHCSSISMLLVTLQVSQSFSQSAKYQNPCQGVLDCQSTTIDLQRNSYQTTALLAGLSLERRQLFQALIESNRRLVDSNESMSHELQQMRSAVQLQLELPPQVVLQKPVTLLDACGQVSAFHLDFINCAEAFLAILKIRFRQHGVEQRGLQMLDDSQFVLEDRRGKLDLSRPWSQILRPNQKVDMSMIFHRDIHPSICPVCKSLNESGFGSAIECQSCGLYYQRVLELVTEAATSSDDTHATPLDQHDPSYDDGLERISTPEHNDVIDQFRRVRLISTGFQGEFDGHAEPSTTSAGQQLVQEDDGHTTARMHKRRPMPTVGEDIATYQPLTRPLSSYLDLVRHALLSSKTGQMSLAQIFHAIEQKHPFYKSQAQTFGWRTSIRRILKQNPSFCKIERDGASTVWRFSSKRDTPKRKQLRSPPMPIQASAASASPLHLFDMSAALLSGVEQHHKDSLDVRETHDPEKH